MELRLADRVKDADFLFKVYASTRAAEMSLWGWTSEQEVQFLLMQHQAQQRAYYMQYPDLVYKIILTDEKPAGRAAVAEFAAEFVLVDIALLPEFQNKGLGTKFLQQLRLTAKGKNKPIYLNVLSGNPAQCLYERLGFAAVTLGDVYTTMMWQP